MPRRHYIAPPTGFIEGVPGIWPGPSILEVADDGTTRLLKKGKATPEDALLPDPEDDATPPATKTKKTAPSADEAAGAGTN